MRAVWLTKFGGPEVLVARETPEPEAGPGQVLVDVAFANITFVETQFRSGKPGPFKGEPPLIPGNGVGGVVAAVGEGVDPGLVGRRVVTGTGGSGGYAERVAVDAAGLFEVPEGLALDTAVAVLADGRTATWLFDGLGVKEGERVLVEAAAGGVGSLLVQIARNAGAVVVAAVGGERKAGVARELGADVVVDYRRPGWADEAGDVDVVFDGVGGEIGRAAFGTLRPAGRMVSYGLASGEWAGISEERAAERGVELVQPAATPELMREATERVLADAARGRVRPLVGQRFPLERAADAHAAIESRATVGKTLLEV
ncbi:zinc-binding dehydrogenase [Actinomadura kijaniata]|uniref:zinc-binding dehydrogenase n=1 Tax=Actinomadura kijaniata TaxID=46161 RepID=UPI00160497CF|nr:zinc-binding dehydrogenase [Actinomadura namibiensis]